MAWPTTRYLLETFGNKSASLCQLIFKKRKEKENKPFDIVHAHIVGKHLNNSILMTVDKGPPIVVLKGKLGGGELEKGERKSQNLRNCIIKR